MSNAATGFRACFNVLFIFIFLSVIHIRVIVLNVLFRVVVTA